MYVDDIKQFPKMKKNRKLKYTQLESTVRTYKRNLA